MNKNLHFRPAMILFWILAVIGCGGRWLPGSPPDVIRSDHLAIVTVKAQDSLQTLAQTHLGDHRKAHWIAEYNGVQKIKPGMRLAIPLKPFLSGGLRPEGYQTVPVLLYPRIVADGGTERSLSAGTFENHLQYLNTNGYSTVSLDRLAAFFNLEDQLPPNAFVMTFDSAERWVYDLAYPLLKRYGYTAAVFIPTGSVGNPKNITWAELAEMAAAGFDIGASGIAARNLTNVARGTDPEAHLKELEAQISQPQKAIAQHLKTQCRYFAYPEGETDDMIIALLKKHGYRAGFTQQRGSNPFFVDTYKVRRSLLAMQGDAMQLRQNLTTFVSAELR